MYVLNLAQNAASYAGQVVQSGAQKALNAATNVAKLASDHKTLCVAVVALAGVAYAYVQASSYPVSGVWSPGPNANLGIIEDDLTARFHNCIINATQNLTQGSEYSRESHLQKLGTLNVEETIDHLENFVGKEAFIVRTLWDLAIFMNQRLFRMTKMLCFANYVP